MDVAGMLKAYNYEVRKNIRNILCKPIKAILPMSVAKVTETITSFTKRFDDAILTPYFCSNRSRIYWFQSNRRHFYSQKGVFVASFA
jgi:hypothetical protein